ncbi:hypothetical protein KSC_006850 [Ktedonobacter sp. SOSP1-52]|nr:hypothetical protein KSC_006850 [Ktedonobacter sp. SOSP1-52]
MGKCIGEWVYEVFITILPIDGYLVEPEEGFPSTTSPSRGAFALSLELA